MYNPVKYTDPSGHFSDQQLKEWFSWLGDDWYQMLPEIYGTELSLLLSSDETDLGDIIQFSNNGDEYFGMFVLSENGTLMLWDIFSKESMGLFEIGTLIAFYNRKGGNDWRQYETQRIYSEGFIQDGLTLEVGWNNGETQRISVRQPIKSDCSPDYLCYVDFIIAGGTLLIGGVSHNPAMATVAVVDMTITAIGVFDATYENQIFQFQADPWSLHNPYQDCQYYGCQFK
jgi:hypothetical protein